ncbi:MAG: hypothetical protein IPL84_18095 [Chitinophagaceae bacterium]|nr:hypothetical protein [Chitinophagaceae bacterium]
MMDIPLMMWGSKKLLMILEFINCSPAISGCGMAGNQPVSIQVKNYSSTTFTNVPVYY